MAFYLKQSNGTGREGGSGGERRRKNHPAERVEGDSITLERNHSRREEERPTLHITLRISTRAIENGGRRRGGESDAPLGVI